MKACSYSTRYKGKGRPKCVGNTFAPCDSCLAKYFRVGRRVFLNGAWADWGGLPMGKKARVVGLARTQGCIRIIFDGQKITQIFHCTFLERGNGTNKRRRRAKA